MKLDASEADTRLVVSLTLGPSEGRRLLSEADADGDGVVSEREATTFLDAWGAGLREELPVEVDGARVPLEFTDPFLDPVGRVSAVPVTVEMVAHLPITEREALIVVHDRMVRREIFERTDVLFRGHDGAEIRASGFGESPRRRELDLAFGPSVGRGSPEALSASVRYPNRAPTPSRGLRWALVVLVGVALAFLSLVGARALARRLRMKNEESEP